MGTLANLQDQAKTRLDGWINTLTGLGDALRDKVLHTQIQRDIEMTEPQLEALFQSDDMAARICEKIPEDALRQGVGISIQGSEDGEGPSAEDATKQAEAVNKRARDLKISEALADAATWENVFGGSAIFVGIDDGLPVEEEVNEAQIRTIHFLEVLTRFELEPARLYDKEGHPKFGKPSHYRVTRATALATTTTQPIQVTQLIHETRLIIFPGLRATPRERVRKSGWGTSRLHRVCAVLQQHAMAYQSAAHLMADNAQGVFKLKGLVEAISEENDALISRRMEIIDMGRSVARSIVLDADQESFERKQTPMSGVDSLIIRFDTRLSSAANMPVAVLMGTAVQGLNATGDADVRFYYDTVRAWRSAKLSPRAERIFELIMLSADGGTGGNLPTQWEADWPALWQPTEDELATRRKTDAERDAIYIQNGVYTPEEVAVSRAPELDVQIDLEPRQAEIEDMRQAGAVPDDDPDATEPAEGGEEPAAGDAAPPTPTDSGNPEAKPSKDALAGGQIQQLLDILDRVATGKLGRLTAIQVITASFPISADDAGTMVGSVEDREPEPMPPGMVPGGGTPEPPEPDEPEPPEPPQPPAPDDDDE